MSEYSFTNSSGFVVAASPLTVSLVLVAAVYSTRLLSKEATLPFKASSSVADADSENIT